MSKKASNLNNDKVTLIGVPIDLGAQNLGVDIGPQALRDQGLGSELQKTGLEVVDVGNITCGDRHKLDIGNPRLRYLDEIVRVNEELARLTAGAIRGGRRVVNLGGDNSASLGSVSGASVALDGDLGLIYFDAHGDMMTDKNTLTGNIHGMQLASLMGFGAPELMHVHGKSVKIAKENLLHIGGIDFDQAELDLIKRETLQAFTLLDLLRYNLDPLLKMIDDLASRVANVWVTLDVDVIDRMYAPGAGMPNPRGLTYREIILLASYVGRTCPVVGVDLVEYNPMNDIDNKTAELSIELIANFLGREYSWYSNYMDRQKHILAVESRKS